MTSVSALLTVDEAVSRATALVPVLAERAARTEVLRRMPDETFDDLVSSGLFRITQPRRFGGSELPLQYAFDVIGQLSQGCGSTGWTYSLLTAHEIILSHFPDQAQQEVWGANPDAVMSTCFAGGVPAEVTADGYHIGEGLWRFSSGVHHASWVALLAGCARGRPACRQQRRLRLPVLGGARPRPRRRAGLRVITSSGSGPG